LLCLRSYFAKVSNKKCMGCKQPWPQVADAEPEVEEEEASSCEEGVEPIVASSGEEGVEAMDVDSDSD
jgi:hypothetical protein